MIVTEEIIADKFAEYNKLYYDYELPTPDFGLLNSYRMCGQFSCNKIIGKRYLRKPKIEVSVYYDWKEEDLRNIIVHEMIHYYLAYKHIDNYITHGEAFCTMAQEFNDKYGLNITVRIDTLNFKRNPQAPIISCFFHIFLVKTRQIHNQ